jgi:hypothetical protein
VFVDLLVSVVSDDDSVADPDDESLADSENDVTPSDEVLGSSFSLSSDNESSFDNESLLEVSSESVDELDEVPLERLMSVNEPKSERLP